MICRKPTNGSAKCRNDPYDRVNLSGKYKRSDVAVSKVPGFAGVAALHRRITDRSATPQMDAETCRS